MCLFDHRSKSSMTCDRQQRCGRVTRIRGLRPFLCKFRSEEGNSLVEFSAVAFMFIFLMFAIFDFAHLFFVEMDVQNALQEAARYGSTGNHLPSPTNPNQTLSRVTSIIDTLQNDAFAVNISNIQVSSAGTSNSAGGPGDMLTVSTTVSMPLMTPMIARLFPNGQFTYTTSVTIMNEPFPISETQ
jgi:Flp pilus assembly protein TadG